MATSIPNTTGTAGKKLTSNAMKALIKNMIPVDEHDDYLSEWDRMEDPKELLAFSHDIVREARGFGIIYSISTNESVLTRIQYNFNKAREIEQKLKTLFASE